MSSDESDSVRLRSAALDLILNGPLQVPDIDLLAERSGVPVDVVRSHASGLEEFLTFLRAPLVDALDAALRQYPLQAVPDRASRRRVLDEVLRSVERYPRIAALNQRIVFDLFGDAPANRSRIDTVAYQAAVRLLGVEFEQDPVQMTRLYLAVEVIGTAVLSKRHDLSDPTIRDVVLDALLALLEPAASGEPGDNRRR